MLNHFNLVWYKPCKTRQISWNPFQPNVRLLKLAVSLIWTPEYESDQGPNYEFDHAHEEENSDLNSKTEQQNTHLLY